MNSQQVREANQEKTHEFGIPTFFFVLIYHPSVTMIFLFKVLQFLKISIKLHQILLNFQP
jgi:hypothetical protein